MAERTVDFMDRAARLAREGVDKGEAARSDQVSMQADVIVCEPSGHRDLAHC